jgi:hypothetical protein
MAPPKTTRRYRPQARQGHSMDLTAIERLSLVASAINAAIEPGLRPATRRRRVLWLLNMLATIGEE